MKTVFKLISVAVLLFTTSTAMAQKSGQSMQIQYGTVVASGFVQQKSDAGKAALVGGAVGYGLTRNKSSSKKAAATVTGAALGGAAKRELAAADSDPAFDRALRKVEILCNM